MPPHNHTFKIDPVDFIIANNLDYLSGRVIELMTNAAVSDNVNQRSAMWLEARFILKRILNAEFDAKSKPKPAGGFVLSSVDDTPAPDTPVLDDNALTELCKTPAMAHVYTDEDGEPIPGWQLPQVIAEVGDWFEPAQDSWYIENTDLTGKGIPAIDSSSPLWCWNTIPAKARYHAFDESGRGFFYELPPGVRWGLAEFSGIWDKKPHRNDGSEPILTHNPKNMSWPSGIGLSQSPWHDIQWYRTRVRLVHGE